MSVNMTESLPVTVKYINFRAYPDGYYQLLLNNGHTKVDARVIAEHFPVRERGKPDLQRVKVRLVSIEGESLEREQLEERFKRFGLRLPEVAEYLVFAACRQHWPIQHEKRVIIACCPLFYGNMGDGESLKLVCIDNSQRFLGSQREDRPFPRNSTFMLVEA